MAEHRCSYTEEVERTETAEPEIVMYCKCGQEKPKEAWDAEAQAQLRDRRRVGYREAR